MQCCTQNRNRPPLQRAPQDRLLESGLEGLLLRALKGRKGPSLGGGSLKQ